MQIISAPTELPHLTTEDAGLGFKAAGIEKFIVFYDVFATHFFKCLALLAVFARRVCI